MRQAIEIRYLDSTETPARELIGFRATFDPMLMRDNRAVMLNDTSTARKGMFWKGEICESQPLKGRPESRAKLQICRLVKAVSLIA
jgi:hypothetical protein